MPKVLRKPLPTHVVVVDTSFLWHADKSNAIDPTFVEFWLSQKREVALDLLIPSVVFGELHFQQSTSASKVSAKISDHMLELAGITQAQYSHRESQERIREKVERKLKRALGRLGATVVDTPIDSIDWKVLVECAIWKRPPFTHDPKNPEVEKGFRDALILETLCSVASAQSEADFITVFMSKDTLLRQAAEVRLANTKNFQAFASLEEFRSYVALAQQSSTQQFIRGILGHARNKFYKVDDHTSILLKEKITAVLEAEFSKQLIFDHPIQPIEISPGVFPTVYWHRVTARWTVGATQFRELVGDREFHWTTRYSQARLFERRIFDLPLPPSPSLRTLVVAAFDIHWKATVKADGRFMQTEIVNRSFVEKTLIDPTADNVKAWNLILPSTFSWA